MAEVALVLRLTFPFDGKMAKRITTQTRASIHTEGEIPAFIVEYLHSMRYIRTKDHAGAAAFLARAATAAEPWQRRAECKDQGTQCTLLANSDKSQSSQKHAWPNKATEQMFATAEHVDDVNQSPSTFRQHIAVLKVGFTEKRLKRVKTNPDSILLEALENLENCHTGFTILQHGI